jgi:hypothetical protein
MTRLAHQAATSTIAEARKNKPDEPEPPPAAAAPGFWRRSRRREGFRQPPPADARTAVAFVLDRPIGASAPDRGASWNGTWANTAFAGAGMCREETDDPSCEVAAFWRAAGVGRCGTCAAAAAGAVSRDGVLFTPAGVETRLDAVAWRTVACRSVVRAGATVPAALSMFLPTVLVALLTTGAAAAICVACVACFTAGAGACVTVSTTSPVVCEAVSTTGAAACMAGFATGAAVFAIGCAVSAAAVVTVDATGCAAACVAAVADVVDWAVELVDKAVVWVAGAAVVTVPAWGAGAGGVSADVDVVGAGGATGLGMPESAPSASARPGTARAARRATAASRIPRRT